MNVIKSLWHKHVGQKWLAAAKKEVDKWAFVEDYDMFGWLSDDKKSVPATVLKHLNTQDEAGNTLLHYLGFKDGGRLIGLGADANICNKEGEVPLKYLVSHPHAEIDPFHFPTTLLKATNSENLNKVYQDGETILTAWLKNEEKSFYLKLLQNILLCGIDPMVENNQGETPLWLICEKLLAPVPEQAVRHVKANEIEQAINRHYNTLSQMAGYCLKNNIGLNEKNKQQLKNAFLAVLYKKTDMFKHRGCLFFCLNIGAYAVDETHKEPAANDILHKIAARKSAFAEFIYNSESKNLVEQFLNKLFKIVTDIEAKNEKGQTPLQVAVESGNEEFALLLISKGADITTQDKNGQTLLHSAAKAHAETILKFLLAKNELDINAVDANGATPLLLARGNKTICSLLLDHSADIAVKSVPNMVFDFQMLTSKQTADMLIAKGGVDVARKTKKLLPAMEYMNHNDRMRAYVHIQKHLTEKEKEDIEAVIRSGAQKAVQKITAAQSKNALHQHPKERD